MKYENASLVFSSEMVREFMYFGGRAGYVGDLKHFVGKKKKIALFINPNTKLKTEALFIYFCTFLNLHWKGKHKVIPNAIISR